MEFPGLINYWIVIVLMMVGFYIVIAQGNLIKKIIGLNIFQVSVFIFYITIGKVTDGSAPIMGAGIDTYSNPLPHVLILTAIVVGVATTALGLAMIVRIRGAYNSIESDEIEEAEKSFIREYGIDDKSYKDVAYALDQERNSAENTIQHLLQQLDTLSSSDTEMVEIRQKQKELQKRVVDIENAKKQMAQW